MSLLMETKQKPRGLQQILSDAGTFTSDDIRMAARMGVIEGLKKAGGSISLNEPEAICDSIAKTILRKHENKRHKNDQEGRV